MRTQRTKIVLIGGGGHAKVVIDAAKNLEKFEICGITDPNLTKDSSILGVKVLGKDEILPKLFKEGIKNAFIGIGSIGDSSARRKIYENLKNLKFRLPVVIHKSASIASDVLIEEGAFVAAGAVVNPGTRIGRNTIINTRASVDHDCVIGDFVHIAPGAVLSGEVTVDDDIHIGANATVIQGIHIKKDDCPYRNHNKYIIPAGSVTGEGPLGKPITRTISSEDWEKHV